MSDLPLLGFGLPVSGRWATTATMLHVARRAEALGYDALWTFQRLLQPVGGVDEGLNPSVLPVDDPSYAAVHDPLLPLALVAGHTERIRLGSATVCAPFLAPVVLAKAAVTLDLLSAGRFTLGIGSGWMPQEYEATGVPLERRGARMEEYLRCLHALWAGDPGGFAGEFYTVPRARIGVHPLQRPHPPVLVGGSAPAALRRAGRLAEGWISSTKQDLVRLDQAVAFVREGAREAGRDPDAVRIVVRAVPELDVPRRGAFTGTVGQVRADVAAVAAQGASEVFFDLNFSARVVSSDVDAERAGAYVERVLEAFAPA